MSNHNKISLAYQLFNAAYDMQQQGQVEEAVKLYKDSLRSYPTPEAHTFLGWSYGLMGQYELAIEECNRAIELDPDYGNPYNDIGSYLISLKKYEEAVPWLEKALESPIYEPRHFPHFNLGRIKQARGDWHGAIDCYTEALTISPEFFPAKKALINITALLN